MEASSQLFRSPSLVRVLVYENVQAAPASVYITMPQAYTARGSTTAYGVNRSAILAQHRLEYLRAFRAQLGDALLANLSELVYTVPVAQYEKMILTLWCCAGARLGVVFESCGSAANSDVLILVSVCLICQSCVRCYPEAESRVAVLFCLMDSIRPSVPL